MKELMQPLPSPQKTTTTHVCGEKVLLTIKNRIFFCVEKNRIFVQLGLAALHWSAYQSFFFFFNTIFVGKIQLLELKNTFLNSRGWQVWTVDYSRSSDDNMYMYNVQCRPNFYKTCSCTYVMFWTSFTQYISKWLFRMQSYCSPNYLHNNCNGIHRRGLSNRWK